MSRVSAVMSTVAPVQFCSLFESDVERPDNG